MYFVQCTSCVETFYETSMPCAGSYIFLTSDGGDTWIMRTLGGRGYAPYIEREDFSSIALSSDGSKIAVAFFYGPLCSATLGVC